ncbi:MAG: phospholipase D family protein [Ottowia sp.]|uniref:phospholipase D family protein n=1 Tax=Ottowia sp. TaxID=1898956 RepID=UPI0039E57A40
MGFPVRPKFMRLLRILHLPPALLLAALLALAGCGSLPKAVERPASSALEAPEATALGQLAAARRPASARTGESGFALVDSPDMAYASRLALTQQARRTLDIQYYAIHADASTRALLRAVRAAAARGVRVRILLDDFNSTGQNALVMGMAFLPGVEMRMFNPLPGDRGAGALRALGSLHDFRRIQHRMHNKLYIADNAWGITGGRNLGDAYFGTADGSNFIDMDVLAVGPVVQAMSASFDRYWNNPLAYPVASLISAGELRRLRETTTADAPPPEAPAPLPPALDLARLPLAWAPAALRVDEPAKLVPELNDEHTDDTVVDGMLSLLRLARRDALIVSPYFVPGEEMKQVFAELVRRGVRVRVLTNSLASSDAPLAHVGYARHREALIRQGVELYEMRALQGAGLNRTVFGSSPGGSQASLHAKMLIVDGRVISIGSMNLDWRSKLQNTEVALVIRSRALARQAAAEVEEALNGGAWRMELTPEGRLLWRAPPGAGFGDAHSEPDAGLGLRLLMKILGPLAPDEML